MTLSAEDLARIARRWGARPEYTRPLTLRAVSAAPVVWHRAPPRIEGLLQLAAILETLGALPEAPPREPAWVECPIARADWCGVAIDAASFPAPVGEWAWTHRHLRKRPDAESYTTSSGRVLIAGGEFKALDRIESTLTALAIEWRVRADLDRLTRLLPHCTAVGRSTAGGLGAVAWWEVYDDPDDAALVRGGVAQRPLPVDPEHPLVSGSEIRTEPLRPPYWHPGVPRVPCMMPEVLC